MKSQLLAAGGVVCVAALATACEPGSLTEARDQIGRGGARVIEYVIPVLVDSVQAQDFVDTLETTSDLDTTSTGLLAIRSDPESLSVEVGDELRFENVQFDLFTGDVVIANPNIPVGTTITLPTVSYPALTGDTILEGIDTLLVESGTLVITTGNRLPATVSYTLAVDGFFGAGGSPISASGTLPASPTGAYVYGVLNFDLAGVRVVPAAAAVQISGTATTTASPIDPALGTAAVTQIGSIATIEIQTIVGPLDPANSPELVIDVEKPREFLRDDFDFGDFEDAAEASTLNDAVVEMLVENSSGAPALLSDFAMGVVTLNPDGSIPRDPSGDPVYEVDPQGQPILIPVTDPGQTTLTLGRGASKTVSLQGAPLVDRLFHLLLDDERAAIVTAGTVAVGDGGLSRIDRTDTLGVVFDVTVAFDLTVPDTGVVISRFSDNEGLDLDSREADSLISRIVSPVEFTAILANGVPFGTEIDIAFVSGLLPEDTDVFAEPDAVIVPRVTIGCPTVDQQGRVSQVVNDTVVVQLSNNDVRELLDEYFSAQARIRLLPGTGGGGRSVVQATDVVSIKSRVHIQIRAGKSQ